ncbi:MAG: hypothetical protein ACKVHA_03115 [Fidelibacterota bacterium]
MQINKIKFIIVLGANLLISSCSSVKTQVPSNVLVKGQEEQKRYSDTSNRTKSSKNNNLKLKNWDSIDLDKLEDDYFSLNQNKAEKKVIIEKKIEEKAIIYNKSEKSVFEPVSAQQPFTFDEKNKILKSQKDIVKNKNGYSNSILVKTVYELAMETKPPLFLPHDEFETADEYKNRVTNQVKLMKEIVQMTSIKMDIKNAQRVDVAKEKELKKISLIESFMAESSSPIEFTPNDIGRYNAEKETFPVVLHDVQYQISVPREEARAFKENFKSIKIKGLKQLKPQYDIAIKASKAHIRSRPNGSIIGIASEGDVFEHIQDEDEWHKINYKGQFGFTHENNAELKLVDIANEYEYLDLVAIHPTTGSFFAMISIDELVKAPLNLASRKRLESGQADGPK